MIRICQPNELEQVYAVINDGAIAYRGIIPEDCWKEPYMPWDELQHEVEAGVEFWGREEQGRLSGVMGLQGVKDVTLIRHAYVLTAWQRRGIGARLLSHLRGLVNTPMLIGTWADAFWAIRFYEKNGFHLVGREQKDLLLDRYWTVPPRQRDVSVVLADSAWRDLSGR